MSSVKKNKKQARIIADIVLIFVGILFVLPLGWLFFSSLDAHGGLSARIPEEWSIINYKKIMTTDMTFRPLFNSFILSASTAIVTILIAVLAAYPLSRYKSKFLNGYMYSILFVSGLPITAIMIPVYSLFVNMKLLDSTPAVVAFLSASSLPMAIFMSKNFMDSIPVSLEEAAWVDGATPMSALRTVVVPLMKQGIAAISIFIFIGIWGNFFVPYILFIDADKLPAAVSIYSFFGRHGTVGYGQLAAFSVVYTTPAVLLYVFISRGLGAFALSGGVKG